MTDDNQPTIESTITALAARVTALEAKPTATGEDALTPRVVALESNYESLLRRLQKKLGSYF